MKEDILNLYQRLYDLIEKVNNNRRSLPMDQYNRLSGLILGYAVCSEELRNILRKHDIKIPATIKSEFTDAEVLLNSFFEAHIQEKEK